MNTYSSKYISSIVARTYADVNKKEHPDEAIRMLCGNKFLNAEKKKETHEKGKGKERKEKRHSDYIMKRTRRQTKAFCSWYLLHDRLYHGNLKNASPNIDILTNFRPAIFVYYQQHTLQIIGSKADSGQQKMSKRAL